MVVPYKVLFNFAIFITIGTLFYVYQNENFLWTGENEVNLAPAVMEDYNLWCIFTKANSSYKLKQNFRRFISSLVVNMTVPVALHIISDNTSQIIANEVLRDVASAKPTLSVCTYLSIMNTIQ